MVEGTSYLDVNCSSKTENFWSFTMLNVCCYDWTNSVFVMDANSCHAGRGDQG